MDLTNAHLASDEEIMKGHRPSRSPKQTIAVGALATAYQCLRKPVLDRIFTEWAEAFSDNTCRTMAMGKAQEPVAKAWMHRLGIHLLDAQLEVTDHAPQFPILGYCDYAAPDGSLVEMKTCDGNVFRTYVLPLADGQRIQDSGYWLFPQYWRQLQSYLWLADRERGWFLFWRRDALEFRFIECPRDEECIAELKAQSETIREHCIAAMLAYGRTAELMHPEVLNYMPEHPPLDANPPCATCRMRGVCEPGRRYILSSMDVDDPWLAERLRIVEEHEAAAKAKTSAWDEVRARLNAYWDANAPKRDRYEVVLPGEFIRMVGTLRSDGARVWKRHEMEVAS